MHDADGTFMFANNSINPGHRDVSVAILVSGHLRDTCADQAHLAPFLRAVDECRSLARCDVFLHTWDTLHPVRPESSGALGRDANAYVGGTGGVTIELPRDSASSLPCVGQIQSRLRPAAFLVEAQPAEVIPRYGNATWSRFIDKPGVRPLAGLRASIYAAAAVNELKNRRCPLLGCGPYQLSVRLRPDLYLIRGKDWVRVTTDFKLSMRRVVLLVACLHMDMPYPPAEDMRRRARVLCHTYATMPHTVAPQSHSRTASFRSSIDTLMGRPRILYRSHETHRLHVCARTCGRMVNAHVCVCSRLAFTSPSLSCTPCPFLIVTDQRVASTHKDVASSN